MTPTPVCRHCGKPIHTNWTRLWFHPNGYAGCSGSESEFGTTYAQPADQKKEKTQMSNEDVIRELQCEVFNLQAQHERDTAPISDEEWSSLQGRILTCYDFNQVLANRRNPPKKEPTLRERLVSELEANGIFSGTLSDNLIAIFERRKAESND